MITGVVFRRIKDSNKKIKMSNPKGGAFIDDCIDLDSIYELVDPVLEIVVKQMLNLPPSAGLVVISTPVLIIASIVSQQTLKQITILGVSVFADKFKDLAIKAGIGIFSGSIFFFVPLQLVSLTSALVATAIAVNLSQGIGHFECENFVSKVPMERVSEEKTIGFLETLPEKSPKVFIQGSEDTELYILSPDDNGSCFSVYNEMEKSNLKPFKTEPQTRIRRQCEREYVPLKERTKTLADLKRHDSTENREEAAPYIKRYENRRKRIMNERIK